MIAVLVTMDETNVQIPKYLIPVFISMIICGVIISFGFNCGAALNPARDVSARLFLLLMGYHNNIISHGGEGEFEKIFCNPDKTGSAMVTKVIECHDKHEKSQSAELKALDKKIETTCLKQCSGKSGDMSAYKKVDLTKVDLKDMLIEECDPDKTDSAKVIMINECEDKYRSTMTAEAKALAIKVVLANEAEDAKFEKLFCNPGKTNSEIVDMVNVCENKYRSTMSAEMKALDDKIENACHKGCMEKAGNMSAYTMVDLTKPVLKTRLIDECDPVYFKCITKLIENDSKLAQDVDKLEKLEIKKETDEFDRCTMNAVVQKPELYAK
ncbi:unnamed protein product [Medioppia subpectinata]|uniref:Uncharacterized protein n=1 Tax=Medioppia subpectinata TaxID=1979941 RepID=A0A7R9KCD0_9ACAR|nr:unnamed protein product [Medioppia subpectinata]CAG2100808.1 unnamed protein product [Medioppia subpectinata]